MPLWPLEHPWGHRSKCECLSACLYLGPWKHFNSQHSLITAPPSTVCAFVYPPTLPCSMASRPRIMGLLGTLQETSATWAHPSKCQQGFVHLTAFSPISPYQPFTFCAWCYPRYFSFSSECFLHVGLQPALALLHQAKVPVKTQEVPASIYLPSSLLSHFYESTFCLLYLLAAFAASFSEPSSPASIS